MPLNFADPSADPAAEPTLPERFNSYVEETLGLSEPLPSWSLYAFLAAAGLLGYAGYNKLVANRPAFAGNPRRDRKTGRFIKGKSKKGKGKSKAKTKVGKRAHGKASAKKGKGKGKSRSAWNAFFAKGRKAGKSAKQIGREWRAKKRA